MKILFGLIFINFYLIAFAQPKDFEGVIGYQTKVKSKVPGINDDSWARRLMMGDSEKVYIRHGFYRHSSPTVTIYYHPKNQKIYYWYKSIDTLFYIDYSQDSSKLLNIRKEDGSNYINELKCNKLNVATDQAQLSYQYSPTLYMNPTYDANNTFDRFDAFAREAQSVYLAVNYECSVYSYNQTATSIQQQHLNDTIFILPSLPVRKYAIGSIGKIPEFNGGIPAYTQFLVKNLKAKLGAKYIPILRNEKMSTQVVKMQFLINENGAVQNIEVLNGQDVHPKLAEEAVRVMKKCPNWKPAVFFGKNTVYQFRNSLTFAVTN